MNPRNVPLPHSVTSLERLTSSRPPSPIHSKKGRRFFLILQEFGREYRTRVPPSSPNYISWSRIIKPPYAVHRLLGLDQFFLPRRLVSSRRVLASITLSPSKIFGLFVSCSRPAAWPVISVTTGYFTLPPTTTPLFGVQKFQLPRPILLFDSYRLFSVYLSTSGRVLR